MRKPLVATLLLAFAVLALPSGAATRTWTGAGASTNWSDSGNWGGVVPGPGDRALFTSQLGLFTVAVDTPVNLDGIDFSGDSTFVLSGSTVTLTGTSPITVTSSASGTLTFTTNVTFAAPGPTISVAATVFPGPRLQLLRSTVTFSGGTVQLQAGSAVFGGQVLLQNVHEAAPTSIVVTGNASTFLGNNVLTGPLTNNANYLGGSGLAPFGAAPVVMQQGTLSIFSNGPTTIGPLSLFAPTTQASLANGSLFNSNGGPLRIQGAVTTSSRQTIVAQGDVLVKGRLGGSGVLEILGAPAAVELDGAGGTFSGTLLVDAHATLAFGGDSAITTASHLDSTGGSILIGSTRQSVSEFSCAGPLEVAAGEGSLTLLGAASVNDGCELSFTVPSSVSPLPATTYAVIVDGTRNPLPQFGGVADGTVVNVNGALMTASYHGGQSGLDLVLLGSGLTPPSVPPAFTASLQDMWWGGLAENGWGFSLIQHGDILFGGLYIYDANGNPVWLVMPGGSWNSTHLVYGGSLYEPGGSPFYAYNAPQFAVGRPRGLITISFQDANSAILDYTIDGVTGRKLIQREIFGNGAPSGVNRSDLWWGGISQNGWGITILQQGTTLFAVWFTYGSNGLPIWYVVLNGAWNSAGDTYSGTLDRTTGSPWLDATYDPSKLNVITAGSYSIQFTGDTATFTYTADGHSGSMALVREPF